MPSNMHRRRVLESNGFNQAIKPSHDKDKFEKNMNNVTTNSSDNNSAISDELTLDDFGGRSDALGG